jgi:hypothetical protein
LSAKAKRKMWFSQGCCRHKHFLGLKLNGDFNKWFLMLGALKNIMDDVFTQFSEKRTLFSYKSYSLTLKVIQLRPFYGILR